jgi:hypothetical protein
MSLPRIVAAFRRRKPLVALGFAPERHKEREGDGRARCRHPASRRGFSDCAHRSNRGPRATGCVAVSDAEIREVWSLVPTGADVVIHP